ncbi:MAG: hypothetical protein IPH80_37710 [Myxococcales bacterium]|nr:hypothetical protein [Myxococcales bacterium]
MSALRRGRELAALVDEFAPDGWRRDPAWWALLGTAAMAEPWGRGATAYLASDADPGTDTFMAAPTPLPRDAADWIAWAVASAHAARAAVAHLDGTLPDQPLAVAIARAGGSAHTTPLAQPGRVGFAIGARVWHGQLDDRGPAHDADLARALARTLRGQPSRLTLDGPPPQVVVALGDDAPSRIRHGHRRAWTAAGGPWLGVARMGPYTAVTTCHLVVDGWGHALLTQAIAAAVAPPGLRVDAADVALPPLAIVAGEPLELCWGPAPAVGAVAGAYALGVVLHRRGDPRARRSPPLQLPVAPGAADDPARFARRVRPALLSVRFSDGRPEPLDAFAARARAAIAREAAGAGIATRLLAGLHGLPLPLAIKRRALAGGPSRLTAGPSEHLAGDACLSMLRLPDGPALIAASAPPPQIPRSRGAAVVTVVRAGADAIATVATVGRCDAADLLRAWRREVEAVAAPTARG